MILKNTTTKKSLTKINKNTFLLLPNILRATNTVSLKMLESLKKSIPYPGKLRFFEVDNSCLSY
jgi:hypothetical protein